MVRRVVVSSNAERRLAEARKWLQALPVSRPVLLVGASADALAPLCRSVVRGRGASFGCFRLSLHALATELALPVLSQRERALASPLALEALVARTLHGLRTQGKLGTLAELAERPHAARAIMRTLEELCLEHVDVDTLQRVRPELAGVHAAYLEQLAAHGLANRAELLQCAQHRAEDRRSSSPLLGLPTLWLDVALESQADRTLVRAVTKRARHCLACVPKGDASAQSTFERLSGKPAASLDQQTLWDDALARLQSHLFEPEAPRGASESRVDIVSAPNEGRECVEIARRMHQLATQGVRFERMAIALRQTGAYAPHVEHALERAAIPAYFTRGTTRPDPSGRALLALLTCASEKLSVSRFAEYLSLAVAPLTDAQGQPPPGDPDAAWAAPELGQLQQLSERGQPTSTGLATSKPTTDTHAQPVIAGSLRAPRYWERLLLDAAVIAGQERWTTQLDGLRARLQLERCELAGEDEAQADRIGETLEELARLRAFALPLIEELARLPQRARWGQWCEQLSKLATRAIRQPQRVLAVLSELGPMRDVGPVGRAEVRMVLAPRLSELGSAHGNERAGRVWVGGVHEIRGQSFEVVFVPGLTEKLFPEKVREDPLLLDADRARLGPLRTRAERVQQERMALRLAVGSATRSVVLSYPRNDAATSRPRVPSFYGLEVLRAAEGRLPGFGELMRRADQAAGARSAWPAPEEPEQAIDAAEYDLAVLQRLLSAHARENAGGARYLLHANPHLARALRFRARRWETPTWTRADGLIQPTPEAKNALSEHSLERRAYSASALSQYAVCPYRFYLQAVVRLAPQQVPQAIDQLDPMQRGSLLHEVQHAMYERLREHGLLPLSRPQLEQAWTLLDEVLGKVADRHRRQLAPAIERVWQDSVEQLRGELREWLRRQTELREWQPWRFELGFGLGKLGPADASAAPVRLESGLLLRGRIDLVEAHQDKLRATDHKTGKARVSQGSVIEGGRSLQPLLYALALEALYPDQQVHGGRLYYCTSEGDFEERQVALNPDTRESAKLLAETIGGALTEGFLPAAPEAGACERCPCLPVCGPYEEQRTLFKNTQRLDALRALRSLR